ncbi:MAG TPA: hypothetical protein ENJ84_10785 [Gammaproteobacteria bacterium]|nr:hypothetical protein [Gammaproteobacteria bacterium]
MIQQRFTLMAVFTLSALAACSSPEDPFTPNCKQFTEHLLNRVDGLEWKEASTEKAMGDDLVVNLSYVVKGDNERLTASCAYQADADESDFAGMSGHSQAPYRVTLNGVEVNDADMVKMSARLFGQQAKETMDAAVKGAREMGHEAKEKMDATLKSAQEIGGEALGKAKSAVGHAAGQLQDAMDK